MFFKSPWVYLSKSVSNYINLISHIFASKTNINKLSTFGSLGKLLGVLWKQTQAPAGASQLRILSLLRLCVRLNGGAEAEVSWHFAGGARESDRASESTVAWVERVKGGAAWRVYWRVLIEKTWFFLWFPMVFPMVFL